MKQVEVTILGQGYMLGCPEGGEELLASAVADVDREMTSIRDAGKVKARERIAVLAALNIAYQLADLRRSGASAAAARDTAVVGAPPTAAGAGADDLLLRALVERIDSALESDGHLI
jgi:cell division protein ZapA